MYADHPGMAAGDGYTFWKDIWRCPWAGQLHFGIGCKCYGVMVLKPCSIFYASHLVFEFIFAVLMMKRIFALFFLDSSCFCCAFARRLFVDGDFYFLGKKL